MKRKYLALLFGALSLLACSCSKNSRFKIDTSKNRVEVKIHRFDQDFLSLDTKNMQPGIEKLYSSYPEFLNEFAFNILDTDLADTAAVTNLFRQYLLDNTYAPANRKTKELYADISGIEKKISDAYTYIHHYFPEVKLPEIYFYVSGFNRQVIMNENFIAIGTDFYLGSDFPLYKKLAYQYMIPNMCPENLAPDLVSATLFRMFVMNSPQNRLLDNMLFRGKVMYLLSVFMPDEKPEILMGYSPEQWAWSKKYEKDVWGAIVDKKHLFSTDMQLIGKYMNEAPFTTPISQESPGRLGTFIGWQIIQSYMNKNKEIGLKDLMNENNYQKILEKSGYRP